jgi:Fe2+ or Zn2+ uptake regulation protein
MPVETNYASLLKERGLKVTPKRMQVYQLLAQAAQPYLLSEIQDKLFSKKLNRITLYRILNDLEEKGLLRIFFGLDGQKYIEAKNQKALNEKKDSLKHLHFQCNQCDALFCFDNVAITGLPQGFSIQTDKTVLAGICEKCV